MARVFLCALTGFGNVALDAFLEGPHSVEGLCTRRERGPYPYHASEDLWKAAEKKSILVYDQLPSPEWFLEKKIDGLVAVTFHKIIPGKLLKQLKFAVNAHPSLLPKYRGASPLFWALYKGECETGWTLHQMTEKLDQGDVYRQLRIGVNEETQGELRLKMASCLKPFLQDFFDSLEESLRSSTPQDESQSTSFPRFQTDLHSQISVKASQEEQERHLRALLPWPGGTFRGKPVTSLAELRRLRAQE